MKRYCFVIVVVCLSAFALSGCHRETIPSDEDTMTAMDPCAIALARPATEDGAHARIVRLQHQVRESSRPVPYLDQLGWAYVARARASYDPGYYALAQSAARCIDEYSPKSPESLLLRGHVLHQYHAFDEAETLARRLVTQRGLSFDFALLGDVLLEQGQLEAAADAYQSMMDQKPSPRAYVRAAHVRWLKGDVDGAIEAMKVSVAAGASRDMDSAAWSHVRLASYLLGAGESAGAEEQLAIALELVPDYAPALLTLGRARLYQGRVDEAVSMLGRAAELNPLPEYEWALIEALRESGRSRDALEVEARLRARGEAEDPRTFALYLATQGDDHEAALRLVMQELEVRADVHTLDAVAWALRAAGRHEEAARFSERALAEGTKDARLFLHAGVVARELGDSERATTYLRVAASMEQMLLPSERAALREHFAAL